MNFDRIVYSFLAATAMASCAVQCTVSSAQTEEQCVAEAASDDMCLEADVFEGGE